jgi:phosphoribosyl 1,2-cyclic phosphate phosphodiesterase
MELIFLGTGAAWALPELGCDCLICREMRKRGEKRQRTALLLSGETKLLIDCGPDIADQLSRHNVESLDFVLISHEHGDHYLGLDELVAYQRTTPKDLYRPIPVYLTAGTWDIVKTRFAYLQDMGVIKVALIKPGKWSKAGGIEIFPFKTNHGPFAKGSVGFAFRFVGLSGTSALMVYTSDFIDIPEIPSQILEPEYLIIQSYWLNEPVINRPNHMSFQRAIDYIKKISPLKETFLVHMGDTDQVPGDPANQMSKKREARDPLRPPSGGDPYPIPLGQKQWQEIVERILTDRGMSFKVIVAQDDLIVPI